MKKCLSLVGVWLAVILSASFTPAATRAVVRRPPESLENFVIIGHLEQLEWLYAESLPPRTCVFLQRIASTSPAEWKSQTGVEFSTLP